MYNRRTFMTTTLAAGLIGTSLLANDEGLYQDAFDPQSSFVRVLSPDQSFASIGGQRITDYSGGLSSYVNVMPGAVELTHAGGTLSLSIAPSTHYTVVLQANAAPVVLTDVLELNPAKADVALYNLSGEGDVALYVPAARAEALKAVGAGATKAVALKAPLTLDFEMRRQGQTLAAVQGVSLTRRGGVSFVLTGASGGYTAAAVANSYLR